VIVVDLTIENLQQVVETLEVGVVVIDQDNNIVVFNRKAGEMLQQDPETRIGTSLLLCHPERAEPGVLKIIDQMKSGELDQYGGFVHFAGRMLYEYITPLKNQAGEYIGAIAEMRDAKERSEFLKSRGEWKEIEEHGLGDSSPRSPVPG
jgi:PAS domain S-box-containing protein